MTDRIPSNFHFIAIGGAAMHNLALALHQKGYTVSGSDDEITEPSRSRLAAAGLLPAAMGWFPEKLSTDTKLDSSYTVASCTITFIGYSLCYAIGFYC